MESSTVPVDGATSRMSPSDLKIMRICTGFLFLIVLLVAGCRSLPEAEWERLQAVHQELQALDAEFHRPEQFQAFARVFSKLQMEYLGESERNFLIRLVKPLPREIEKHIVWGRQLVLETVRTRERLKRQQGDYMRLLRRELDRSPLRFHPRFEDLFQRFEFLLARFGGSCSRDDFRQASQIQDELETLLGELRTETASLRQRFEDPLLLDLWKKWTKETINWSAATGSAALIIAKHPSRALLYKNGRLLREYQVDLGWNGLRDKRHQGDGATPEGHYRASQKKGAGETRYHRALLLDYPTDDDTRMFDEARSNGKLPRWAKIGSLIEVHGEGGKGKNWTDGCIALSNPDMRELFEIAYVGMPITVVGKLQ